MKERQIEALREVAAEFLGRESGPQSLITVTGATLSDGGHRGMIFLSVYPDSAQEAALNFANRHRHH